MAWMRSGWWVYPPRVTPEPVPPSRGPEPDSGTEADPGQQRKPGDPPPGERYGPVAIERYLKDDGRALLLYTHAARRDQA